MDQTQRFDIASATLEPYLAQQQHLELLRFITCGSVDDGKSTLIGRLLWEVQQIFDDQLATLQQDSRKYGTQGNKIDFALLVDGLSAEREQGITIDVAYRFFATDKRKFIVADTPGHEQYTRNMVTGASTAHAAVILVDARKGILTQTRRHSYLTSLLGIRNVILAINKMDLVHHSKRTFDRIDEEYRAFAAQLGITGITAIPISALNGDNIVIRSDNTAWYQGPTLIEALENIDVESNALSNAPFRMPVQWVNRPNLDFRGFCGTIVSGTIKPGDSICVLPSGRPSRVARIVTRDGDLSMATAGQSITLTLMDEIDASRGDVISSTVAPAEVAQQFETTIVWMTDQPLLPGRPYFLKIGAATVTATITRLKFKVNINTLEQMAATQLNLNEIGVCNIALDRHVPFDSYADNRNTGSFILIDKINNATAGAGMLHFALRRSHNIHLQYLDINKESRAAIKYQRPFVLWFTGLSGAGKSVIANKVEMQLHALGYHTYLLDGDNIRHGINKDLGFTEADRIENIRRVAEVAKLMVDAGLIVLTAFISPFRAERNLARNLFPDGEFIEIYVDTPLEVAESRDPKGLYRKARRGELTNFTGIDSPYEPPENPDIKLDTVSMPIDDCVQGVVDWILKKQTARAD